MTEVDSLMSTVLDHDHEEVQLNEWSSEYGLFEEVECADEECDYWASRRVGPQPQTNLADYEVDDGAS